MQNTLSFFDFNWSNEQKKEIKDQVLEKIWKLLLDEWSKNSDDNIRELFEILNIQFDITFSKNKQIDKTIYTFSLSESWERKVELFIKKIMVKKLLLEKSNKKPDFEKINNAISKYNKDKNEESKLDIIVKSLEDLKNEKIKANFQKEIANIYRKEENKKKIKIILDAFDFSDSLDLDNLISELDNLISEYELNIWYLKTNFEYNLTIKKPKGLKSYKIKKPIKEPIVLEKMLKYKKQIIITLSIWWVALLLNLWDWETENHSTQDFKFSEKIAKINLEKSKNIKMTNDFIKIVTTFLEKIKNKNNSLDSEIKQFKKFIDSQKDFENIEDYLIIKQNNEEWAMILNINWIIQQINFNTKGNNLDNKNLDSIIKNLLSKHKKNFKNINQELNNLMNPEFTVKKN